MTPIPYTDIAEYESLRVKYDTHPLRHSKHGKIINSGDGQTLMLSSRGGYTCFRIVETGFELPVENVASAIPKNVALSVRQRKTTLDRGLTKNIKQKDLRNAAQKGKQQKDDQQEHRDGDESGETS